MKIWHIPNVHKYKTYADESCNKYIFAFVGCSLNSKRQRPEKKLLISAFLAQRFSLMRDDEFSRNGALYTVASRVLCLLLDMLFVLFCFLPFNILLQCLGSGEMK